VECQLALIFKLFEYWYLLRKSYLCREGHFDLKFDCLNYNNKKFTTLISSITLFISLALDIMQVVICAVSDSVK